MSGDIGPSKLLIGISVLLYLFSLGFHNWFWLYAGLPFIVTGSLLMLRKENKVATIAGKIIFIATIMILLFSPKSSPSFALTSIVLAFGLLGTQGFAPQKDGAKPIK